MFNDLSAPRFNTRKYRVNIVCKELYEEWKKKTGRTETFSEFKAIWNLIAEEHINQVIEERDGVKMAKGMGDIYIGYIPRVKKRFVDYKTSMEHNKKIYHENWDSNGKVAKIIHGTYRRKYTYRMNRWFGFNPNRAFKHKVIAALKAFPTRYKNTSENTRGKYEHEQNRNDNKR